MQTGKFPISTGTQHNDPNNPTNANNAAGGNSINPESNTKDDKDQVPQVVQEVIRLKSNMRVISIGLMVCLSALMYGYSVKQITSVPIAKILLQYSITLDSFVTQSILIGILPIGSMFGSVITVYLLKCTRRLTGVYIFGAVNIGAIVLVNITTFETIIIGRFIEGICVGYYSAMSPAYLKQIAPKQLRKFLGLFFSLLKCLGVLIAIIIQLIFEAAGYDGWRIIISLTAGFSTLQAILIFFFGMDTPSEFVEKGEVDKARQIIVDLYKPQYVDQVLEEYIKQFEMEKAKDKLGDEEQKKNENGQSLEQINDPNAGTVKNLNSNDQLVANEQAQTESRLTFEQKKKMAYCLCLHLNMIKNWMGGNAIISQGGGFVKTFDAFLGKYTSIIINSIQFICIIIGLAYIQKKVGKRPLLLFAVISLSLLNIATAIAMICRQVIAIEVILCVYMTVYGLSYIAPIWAYPSEIIPASQTMFPNILNYVSLATSMLIPPIIVKIMPENNPYPVFLFFGGYGLLAVIHMIKTLRESDGYTYHQIINSFR